MNGSNFASQIVLKYGTSYELAPVFRIHIDLNTDSDLGFFMTKILEIFLWKIKILFLVTNSCKNSVEDSEAQVKTIRSSAKLSVLFFTWNLRFFFLFGHHLDSPGSGSESVLPIRIRVKGSNFNTNPHGSGSETLAGAQKKFTESV